MCKAAEYQHLKSDLIYLTLFVRSFVLSFFHSFFICLRLFVPFHLNTYILSLSQA